MNVYAVLVLFVLSAGAFSHHRAEEESGNEAIRVLSYNIHMWQIGVKDLAKVIRAADADVVGLNEAWNEKRNEEIARELGYHVVYGGQEPGVRPPKTTW